MYTYIDMEEGKEAGITKEHSKQRTNNGSH
jgi:hypothetical protein